MTDSHPAHDRAIVGELIEIGSAEDGTAEALIRPSKGATIRVSGIPNWLARELAGKLFRTVRLEIA